MSQDSDGCTPRPDAATASLRPTPPPPLGVPAPPRPPRWLFVKLQEGTAVRFSVCQELSPPQHRLSIRLFSSEPFSSPLPPSPSHTLSLQIFRSLARCLRRFFLRPPVCSALLYSDETPFSSLLDLIP
eukprot:849474-Pleurochrysis_carterae.AAC.2